MFILVVKESKWYLQKLKTPNIVIVFGSLASSGFKSQKYLSIQSRALRSSSLFALLKKVSKVSIYLLFYKLKIVRFTKVAFNWCTQ